MREQVSVECARSIFSGNMLYAKQSRSLQIFKLGVYGNFVITLILRARLNFFVVAQFSCSTICSTKRRTVMLAMFVYTRIHISMDDVWKHF